MSEDMEELINQVFDEVMVAIPQYLQEAEKNIDEINVENPKEFVYGMIIGMAIIMCNAVVEEELEGTLTSEDKMKIQGIIYKKIPEVHGKIFGW